MLDRKLNNNSKKTIVITGSSRGIGAAIALELASEYTNIIINYNKNKNRALEVLSKTREKNCNSVIYQADVSDYNQAQNLINHAIEQFGKIDILINNTGISKQSLFTDISVKEWHEIFDTNINSMFYCTQIAARNMIKNNYGKIINISSIWGMTGASCEVHYSASKAAVIGFTKALAKELGPSNITVNCVAPGIVNTDMNKFFTPEISQELKYSTPLGRFCEPEEIAKTVKFLFSPDADFITGQVISPNGGFVI